jgi:hypothetical protein
MFTIPSMSTRKERGPVRVRLVVMGGLSKLESVEREE